MSNVLKQLGIKKQEKFNFPQIIFYFLRECHINPLDEEYIIEHEGKVTKITKKGMNLPLFNAIINEMQEHYKREAAQMKKNSRKR